MDEENFFVERHLDTIWKHPDFLNFFKDFFEVKAKVIMPRMKKIAWNCAKECANNEDPTGETCLPKCQEIVSDFYWYIEKELRKTIAKYPRCISDCRGKKEMIECSDDCIKSTLELLSQINLEAELNKFIYEM
ncbi:unnamed protein product [Blepharisma stoltei]|uniref:Uncharacterized protein n=1 Tax=Blepharisma stoltei TaxID=1481888 RepID=A0AAU9JNZ4_9CILI|nr:unnamed protein product [Blepharisma stoltei]